jgi:hypothetical protein
MKTYFKNNRIILIGILATLIVAFSIIGGRAIIESNNKSYDVILDYSELVAMAEQSDHDVSWWLNEFKSKMGITKVGLSEENVISMMNDVEIPVNGKLMGEITKQANWRDQYPEELVAELDSKGFDAYDVLVEIDNSEIWDFVLNALDERFQADKYYTVKIGDRGFAVINGTADITLYTEKYKEMNSKNVGFMENVDSDSSKIMYISLGFLPDKVKLIQDAGMDIVPRTSSYNGWNDLKFAKAVIEEYKKYNINPKYIIVGGEAVIGYDDGIEIAEQYLNDNQVSIGLIENTNQLQNIMQFGVEDIAKANNYNTVRVFSVWNYIQNRYQYYGYPGAEEIENTLFRAVTERNIRVIYFKPVMEFKDLHTYVTDPMVYEQMFGSLEARLAKHDLTLGNATVMANQQLGGLLKLILGFGTILSGILLVDAFLPINRKMKIWLTAIGFLGVVGVYMLLPNWIDIIISFSSAVIYGCLAVTLYTKVSKDFSDRLEKDTKLSKIISLSIITLVFSVTVALIGGLFTAAPISSVNYMLEINSFRGVKAAQLMPIAYFAIAYLAYFGFGHRKEKPGKLEFLDIKDMINTNIKIWMVLFAGVIGGVGVYYIIRTGNDSSLQVSSYEMLFRNKLEDLLVARPRTKEFLFAFPAIMMMVYSSIRKFKLWTIIFGLSGVLGVTSVANTFMHIRTPLYLGFYRTGYSLLFGIIAGVAAIIIFELIYKMYLRYSKSIPGSKGV